MHCTNKSIESKFFLFFWKILSFYLNIWFHVVQFLVVWFKPPRRVVKFAWKGFGAGMIHVPSFSSQWNQTKSGSAIIYYWLRAGYERKERERALMVESGFQLLSELKCIVWRICIFCRSIFIYMIRKRKKVFQVTLKPFRSKCSQHRSYPNCKIAIETWKKDVVDYNY